MENTWMEPQDMFPEHNEPEPTMWYCSLCGAKRQTKLWAEEHIAQAHPGTDAYPYEQEV
jgi:hypothetical protein